jgi:branched-chain amino acid transport system permease protein
VPFAKVLIFIVSAMFISLTGALMAPRFGFINPNLAFNPLVSFVIVIMAFLGGLQKLWGPVLGVVPLIVLSELLQTRFPFWYSILLGLVFMIIIYFVPRGVTGLLEDGWAALQEWLSLPIVLPRGIAGAIEDLWAKLMPHATQKR